MSLEIKMDWYCPFCDEYLPWDHVTYEENHDPRVGGCGYPVQPLIEENENPYDYDTLEEKYL